MQTQKALETQELYKELKSAYETIFGSKQGLKVLEDIKRAGFFYTDTFNENSSVSAWNQGVRSLALHIVTMANPEVEKKQQEEVYK